MGPCATRVAVAYPAMPRATPPRPVLALRVAITGHRWDRLPRERAAAVRETIGEVLRAVTRETGAHLDRHPEHYRGVPRLRLLSGLAEGADRLGAEAALAAPGWTLHAVLPYATADYLSEFQEPESTAACAGLLEAAAGVTELDGVPGRFDAYRPLEWALVEMADLLIAVWDGEAPRGAGGTAHVVAAARLADVPVVRVDARDGASAWLDDTGRLDQGRAGGMDAVSAAIATLLQGPGDPGPADRYFGELGARGVPARLYDRVVAVATGHRIPAVGPMERDPGAERTTRLRDVMTTLPPPVAEAAAGGFGPLLGWSDALATWYAALHRRSFTALFLLASMAVAFGVAARVLPLAGDEFLGHASEVGEVVALLAMLVVLHRARRGAWQQRWLDYRALAERARHLWLLWPVVRTTEHSRSPRDRVDGDPRAGWVAWLVRSTVRAADLPTGSLGGAYPRLVRDWLGQTEVASQRAFHARRRAQADRLGEPLAHLAERMVQIAILLAFARVAVGAADPAAADGVASLVVAAIATALPALAAGLHGFAGLADFGGLGLRSAAIEGKLAQISRQLEALDAPTLESIGILVRRLTREMEGELGAWHASSASRHPHAG